MTHKSNAIRTMDSAHGRNQRQPGADLEPSAFSKDLVQVARMITVGELSSCFALGEPNSGGTTFIVSLPVEP
jgi:hypothetical protein